MSSASTVNVKETPHEPSTLAAFLSYLIPGLGQIYQGRYGKGVLFMVSLLGMFLLGQAMGQWQNVYVPREQGGKGNLVSSLALRWHYVGQFWIGIAAWPALWQYYDTSDPALGRQDPEEVKAIKDSFAYKFQRMPEERELNEFLVNSDKTPDLGWVYTVVAGMLNILVIYDAYAGPVLIALPKPTSKASAESKSSAKKEGVA